MASASDQIIRTPAGIGERVLRPDGTLKVSGEFAYSSDLWADDMLWGATCRSPHPAARIRSIDTTAAQAVPGVVAVMTHEQVPGRKTYGLEQPDQPVLAYDTVRYRGEPIAIVAADHPATAREAADRIVVDYEVLEPVVDPDAALDSSTRALHPGGNVVRHLAIRHGAVDAHAHTADVVVRGEYEIGMQDQAMLGPESGLAIPDGDGGVHLYIATQWLHQDLNQVAASLALPVDMVRLTQAGIGGAFGGREDLSMQIHACLLALRTGRAVKMSYSREESFFGHVHRHPARMRYEHGATADGRLVYVKAQVILDGGAYASTSNSVCLVSGTFAVGPYECPHAHIDAYAVYTNNPPCGAMRGFGAVQVCFGYEAQMDKLAAALDLDPLEIRRRNAVATGSLMPTGQAIVGPAPVDEILRHMQETPMPQDEPADQSQRPGSVANVTHGEGVRRGVGYAISIKNIGFCEGYDDYSTARVRLWSSLGEPVAEVHTAACEVGQGLVTIQAQIARTELGVRQALVRLADTTVGNAGSSSASRQTVITGGAVKAACEAVRERVLELARDQLDGDLSSDDLMLEDGYLVSRSRGRLAALADLLGDRVIEEEREWRPRPTTPPDERGQGDVHAMIAFAAHRAVVDVDVDLGLVRVVELATVQDVGRALNPLAIEGQIEGGTAQGMGLALMEEVRVDDGRILNPSFTDYLIPTIVDMPEVRHEILELAQPDAPYGVNGVGEPPMISSGPAVMAALRAATGRDLAHVPARPEHLVGIGRELSWR
ncbi:MAG: xanthine dehydrogenase subunit D [Solirubrobacteraceae bacterium]